MRADEPSCIVVYQLNLSYLCLEGRMKMEFTPWVAFVDVSIAGVLILIGTILRAKVKIIQELFLPAGLIAGFLGLAFGPNGLGYIPFSNHVGTYSGILIALVFAVLPLTSPPTKFKEVFDRVGEMWAYSQIAMIVQWGLGSLFGIWVLRSIWTELNPAFGLMLASGFSGGHGTAAAVGTAFESLGWDEARSLAMTSATVGILAAVVGGILLVKFGTMRGHTRFLSDFKELPQSLRTGIMPLDQQESMGRETTSPISLDPLTFQLVLVLLIALGGYYLSKGAAVIFPKLSLPVFSCAFIVGIVVKNLIHSLGASDMVEPRVLGRLSGTFTDFLVAFGVASIKLPVVVKYASPLILLFLFGLAYCLFIFFYMGPRMLHKNWYEKALFTWGWLTGTMAMGIAILRIADPKLESRSLDDFAFAYMPMAPVEILVVSLSPLLFANGKGMYFIAACLGSGAVVWVVSLMKKWFTFTPQNQ